MLFYQSVFVVLVSCLLGIYIVTAFPIEIKEIQFLFPPQNTILADGTQNGYETKIDRQLGDSEEEDKIRKSCVQKQNAEDVTTKKSTSSEEDSGQPNNFNDTTPLDGTVVDDPMEVKIYRPECDD